MTNCHVRSWPRSCTVVGMSQQERQRVTTTGGADAPPLDARLARLVDDFPDWDIAYERAGSLVRRTEAVSHKPGTALRAQPGRATCQVSAGRAVMDAVDIDAD